MQCIAQYYSIVHGHTEKELELAAQELRQQAKVAHGALPITATRLADLLANLHTHETILLQRLRDLENRAVVLASMDQPPREPATAGPQPVEHASTLLAPIDLAAVPIFEEYR